MTAANPLTGARLLKSTMKLMARNTIGRLPAPPSRLAGKLAIHGGVPVRDVRLRPYADARAGGWADWRASVGPAFRRIFLSGAEGLPGPLAREFERQWAAYCGCRHALLLPHGTDALRVALAAVFDHDGLEYGGEVIVPNLSFIASATSCLDRRFGVALVDVDPDTMMLDPAAVEAAIVAGRTRAIMPVHQFGHPADMTALTAIARRHGLKIIEDAAQAHGAEWETGKAGALGDAAGFSFQSSKTLACGEGGVLTTSDDAVIARARSICDVGRAPEGGSRWEHPELGWNLRPTEYQASLLLHRLRRFDALQARRAKRFDLLEGLIGEEQALTPLRRHPGVRRHGMYMFAMRYRPERCRGAPLEIFLAALAAEGAPVHRLYPATIAGQPIMRKLMATRPDYVRVLPTPNADRAIDELVYIAHEIFLGTDADMQDIAAAIAKVTAHYAAGGA
ncbi:MAG: DegT/DnrJ/EryC1/StrS family aminotransferase [Methylocystis sp.]